MEEKICHLKLTMKVCILNNQIWNKFKDLLNIRFNSEPIYDGKYIKTKLKTFNEMINTLFSGNEIPKERIHYVCIAANCTDSVLKVDKRINHKFI